MRHDDVSGSLASDSVSNMPVPVEFAASGMKVAPVRRPPVVDANARHVIPGPDGLITLPEGVDLSDIHVVGRDLVIKFPDGTTLVIEDGAVFVPQLVIGDVEVPAVNLAALLIDSEPKPAAGKPLSSGGNFAVDVPSLDPGVPLGDLIQPTELSYIPPEFRELQLRLEEDEPSVAGSSANVSEEGLDAGIPDTIGSPDTTDAASVSGAIGISDLDGSTTVALGIPTGSFSSGGVPIVWAVSNGGHTLTGTAGGETIVTVTINNAGAYDVILSGPFDQPDPTIEDSIDFTVPVTVTDGDVTVPSAIVVTVEDDSPTATQTILTGTVDEDGVAGGIAGGPDDVPGAATVASGNVAALFNSGADAPLTYSLLSGTTGLPSLTSGGVAITYAVVGDTLTASAGGEPVFTFVLEADGDYTFTLLQQLDHPTLNGAVGDDTEDDLSIALGSVIRATDADGDSVTAAPGSLVITVDDDTPQAQDDTATLAIRIDNLGVGPILAEWTDTVLSSGSPITFDRDGDGLTDEIRWGTGKGARSGYGFVDNPALGSETVLTNQAFSLGTFTHYNNPINPPELTSTTLTVNFVAHINGQDVPVGPIEIRFVHDETTNTSDPEASRDVVMITSETMTILIDGVQYELQVRGLVDENGDVVTTVRTFEGQTNSYELLVRFVQTDTVEVSGNVLTNDGSGADDPIGVVAAAGFGGSADNSADPDGNYQVDGQYGVLTLNADGSYTYQLTADVLSVPEGAVEHFVYTIEDFDGDRTTAKLDITLDPERAPVAEQPIAPLADDSSVMSAALVGDMEQRTNSNSVLLGAIAAAGLATDSAAVSHNAPLASNHELLDGGSSSDPTPVIQGPSVDENGPSPALIEPGESHSNQQDSPSPAHHAADAPAHIVADPHTNLMQSVTELLEGSEPVAAAPAQSTFTGGAVGMPAAPNIQAAPEGGAKSGGEVARVLADALTGDGRGPNIDALLAAATGEERGGHAAAEALASHAGAVVSAWDTGGFGGFPPVATMMMADHGVLHPDAVHAAS